MSFINQLFPCWRVLLLCSRALKIENFSRPPPWGASVILINVYDKLSHHGLWKVDVLICHLGKVLCLPLSHLSQYHPRAKKWHKFLKKGKKNSINFLTKEQKTAKKGEKIA